MKVYNQLYKRLTGKKSATFKDRKTVIKECIAVLDQHRTPGACPVCHGTRYDLTGVNLVTCKNCKAEFWPDNGRINSIDELKEDYKMGRPAEYTDSTKVVLDAHKARSKLQDKSKRRAIINTLIDFGGKGTIGELNDHFGFDTRPIVTALIRANWLSTIGENK